MVSHGLPVLRAGDIQKPLINFPFHGGIKHLKELCSDVWLRTAKAWEEGWLQFGCDVASWKALISTRWKTIFNVKSGAHRNITKHLFSLSQPLRRLTHLNAIVKKHSSHYACVFKEIYVEPLLFVYIWWFLAVTDVVRRGRMTKNCTTEILGQKYVYLPQRGERNKVREMSLQLQLQGCHHIVGPSGFGWLNMCVCKTEDKEGCALMNSQHRVSLPSGLPPAVCPDTVVHLKKTLANDLSITAFCPLLHTLS